MHYFTHQFEIDNHQTFAQEASMLGLKPGAGIYGKLANGTTGITVTDPIKGQTYTFVFYCEDRDGDRQGWRFVVTMDTVVKYPALAGHRVLIIND
jgi:hypothetical protein